MDSVKSAPNQLRQHCDEATICCGFSPIISNTNNTGAANNNITLSPPATATSYTCVHGTHVSSAPLSLTATLPQQHHAEPLSHALPLSTMLNRDDMDNDNRVNVNGGNNNKSSNVTGSAALFNNNSSHTAHSPPLPSRPLVGLRTQSDTVSAQYKSNIVCITIATSTLSITIYCHRQRCSRYAYSTDGTISTPCSTSCTYIYTIQSIYTTYCATTTSSIHTTSADCTTATHPITSMEAITVI